MKKMQLKDLNVKSFMTTAKVKGGELFPDWRTILSCNTCVIYTRDAAENTCDPRCL
ncbi:MAG: pinensin family lanthipeptide [Acidobacteriota bacterium]|nr:pinensin family lanthipeptide [Acidobacteriota bacterium]